MEVLSLRIKLSVGEPAHPRLSCIQVKNAHSNTSILILFRVLTLFWLQKPQYHFFLIAWPLKMGPICSPETSVLHYKFILRNIPEERKGKYPLTLPLHSFSTSVLPLYIIVTLANDGRNSRPKHVAVNVMNKRRYGYL